MSPQDEHEIARVLMAWGHARDSDDWDALAECFHGDATIHISWISDTAKAFIAGSKAMAANRKPGSHMKHAFAGPLVTVNGDRAFSRCHVTLSARAIIDDLEFDFLSLFRFFDLFEKRDGTWRILKRTAVYEKDRMDPVHPHLVPASFYEAMDLSAFPPELRFLGFFLAGGGRELLPVPTVYSAEEEALHRECLDWIAA